MIQIKVHPEIEQNLQQAFSLSRKCIKEGADVLVFPEMWNCPYINENIKESVRFFQRCKEAHPTISKEGKCIVIGGTLAHQIENKIYNECLIFDQGTFLTSYAKTHLFEVHTKNSSYQENEVFTPGNHFQAFDTRFGKMGVLICYDMRFPENARLLSQEGVKVLFCPSAFNKTVTQIHWTPLYQVRAMENQIFCVGVNPAHYVHDTFESYGHSIITDPFGKIVVQMSKDQSYQVTEIDLGKIDTIRKRMPFWKIRRTDLYTLEENKYEGNSNQ